MNVGAQIGKAGDQLYNLYNWGLVTDQIAVRELHNGPHNGFPLFPIWFEIRIITTNMMSNDSKEIFSGEFALMITVNGPSSSQLAIREDSFIKPTAWPLGPERKVV